MWTLIFVFYVGVTTGSVSSHSVSGFYTEKACEAAGAKAASKFNTVYKDFKYVCVNLVKDK